MTDELQLLKRFKEDKKQSNPATVAFAMGH